jgi:Ran GTPase-activating protein (RanGAP) involved in mRNA processing and transport
MTSYPWNAVWRKCDVKVIGQPLLLDDDLTEDHTIYDLAAKSLKIFVVALQKATNLRRLYLEDCSLNGVAVGKIIDCLISMPTLRTLDLTCNRIEQGSSGTQSISTFLQHDKCALQYLTLDDNPLGTVGGLNLSEGLIDAPLMTLSLNNCDLGPVGMEHIAESLHDQHDLKELFVSGNKVEDSGGISIGNMLSNNGSLYLLDASYNAMKAEGVRAVINGLTGNIAMMVVRMDDNPGWTIPVEIDEELKTGDPYMVGEITPLRFLRNPVTYWAAQLSDLSLSGLQLSADLDMQISIGMSIGYLFDAGTSLVILDISDSNITTKAVEWMAPHLKENTKLKKLNLNNNKINDKGGALLLKAITWAGRGIKSNETLEKLYLSGNPISEESIDNINKVLAENQARMEALESVVRRI